MTQEIYVKPKIAGQIIRNPERQFKAIPVYGEAVMKNRFWVRRLKEKSVVPTTAAEIKKGKAAELKKAQVKHAAENPKPKAKTGAANK